MEYHLSHTLYNYKFKDPQAKNLYDFDNLTTIRAMEGSDLEKGFILVIVDTRSDDYDV